MINPQCVLCSADITAANDSEEHVLPNAVGGRLKVRGFLCKSCNNRAGHSWDAELASQLQGLCLLVGVNRERGETPAMVVTTTAGESLRMTAKDGLFLAKPTYEETRTETGRQIRFSVRTMDEARRILKGVKAKYPSLDVEAALSETQFEWTAPQGYMHQQFSVGGLKSGRSIVKSALAFAFHIGLPLSVCGGAVQFLRDSAECAAPLGWYYATDVLAERPAETPVTCVGVHANPMTGLILGYVEYLGFHRAVIELGRGYRGEEVRGVHGFDPRTAQTLPLDIALLFDKTELHAIFDYQRIPEGAMERAMAQVLPQALKRQFENEQQRVFTKAVEYGLARSGLKPGDLITPEHAQRLAGLITGYLTPWMAHRIAMRRRAPPPRGLFSDGENDDLT